MRVIFIGFSVLLFVAFVIMRHTDETDIELILQDPLEFDVPADQCDSSLCRSIIELIKNAEETIDFAIYGSRSQTEILEALLQARDRGVMVRGYFDKDANNENYYRSTDTWIREIGDIRDDYAREMNCRSEFDGEPPCKRPDGFNGPLQCLAYDMGQDRILVAGHASRNPITEMSIMHNKFFIVDGKSVWTGSANISDSGTGGYNANAVVILHSEKVAGIYTSEFEQLWNRQDRCIKNGDGVEEFQIPSGKLTTWFSPQDNSLRYGVTGLIARAEKRINIAVFFFTAKYMTADLIAAHNRGVDIRVIIDATSAKNEYSKHEILREAGIPVKIENWGGKMHMKTASIDDQYLVLGSMNWTSAGERSNDENTLLVSSPELSSQFNAYYEKIWQSIPEIWQQKGMRPDPESPDSGTSCNDGVDNDFDNLVDAEDPGCLADPPPLPALPSHQIVIAGRYDLKKNGYRIIRPTVCNSSYPDWFVCIPENNKRGCNSFPYRRFTALSGDSPKLDGDGDGIACEQ